MTDRIVKGIPIAFVLALIGQTVAVVWFLAQLDGEVKQLSTDLVKLEVRVKETEDGWHGIATKLGVVENDLKHVLRILEQQSRLQNADR